MTTTRPNPLPDTLADLLECAVNDMNGLDRTRYTPKGSDWHKHNQVGVADPDREAMHCTVCLGGAVLAGTLRLPIDTHPDVVFRLVDFDPERGYTETGLRLRALDCLRTGNIPEAAKLLYPDDDPRCKAAEALDSGGWQGTPEGRDILNCRIRLANRGHFQGWQDWERCVPCYRRMIDILRNHGI